MAIDVTKSFEDKYNTTETEGFDEDGKAWDRNSRANTYREWKDNYWLEHNVSPLGVPLPLSLFPKSVRLIKGKKLFDFDAVFGGEVVSERLKNAIEDIEPGVHQFVPVEIFHKDGRPYEKPFWFFVICTCLDAINPEMGGVTKQVGYDFENHPDRYTWKILRGDGRDKLAFYKHLIEGRAAWRDRRYITGNFLSDALLARMKNEGMEGWRALSYWHEI